MAQNEVDDFFLLLITDETQLIYYHAETRACRQSEANNSLMRFAD